MLPLITDTDAEYVGRGFRFSHLDRGYVAYRSLSDPEHVVVADLNGRIIREYFERPDDGQSSLSFR